MTDTPDGQRCILCHTRARRGYIAHTTECPQFQGQGQHLGEQRAEVANRYNLFVSKLEPNPKHRDRYTCPSCGDQRHGGLKVDPGRDGPMFWCFGCEPRTREAAGEILAAVGLDWPDIRPTRTRSVRTPSGEVAPVGQPAPAACTLADTLATFRQSLYLDDPQPLYALAAALVANRAPGDPVWLLLVCAPSTGKTEMLSAAVRLPWVVPVAKVTESALLSGTSKKDRAKDATGGVLRQLGDFGVMLVKDFTSVLAQNKDARAEALAALREVYDGRWDRPVGADGGRMLTWQGKAGMVGGVTPALDRYAQVTATLGDRFILLRMPDADVGAFGTAALEHSDHERRMRTELAEALGGLVEHADTSKVNRPWTGAERERLIRLAAYTARARTAVDRDGYRREILYLPQVEGPGRLVKMYARLFGGLEAIGCDPDTAWSVLTRIAVDSVPSLRTDVIRELIARREPARTAQIAAAINVVKDTAQLHLEDLSLLRITSYDRGEDDKSPYLWSATEWLREHWPELPTKSTPHPTEHTEGVSDGGRADTPGGGSGEPLPAPPYFSSAPPTCAVAGCETPARRACRTCADHMEYETSAGSAGGE